jgi:hypothetical protein
MADLNSIGGLHYEMMRRCYNPKSIAFKSYGAKGIKVCEEWHDRDNFRKWCNENGYVKGVRLNRIDSSKDYTPDNCCFGNKNCKIVNGKNQLIKKHIKENKKKKKECGITGKITKDPLYITYQGMHSRCERESHPSYKNYGERGVSVCEEWSGKDGFFNFKRWANRNDWNSNLSLDRIDNNKGYCPENCKFSTKTEQSYNRRGNIYYEYCGIRMPLGMIAKIENVKYGLLYTRVKIKGMTVNEALGDIKKVL